MSRYKIVLAGIAAGFVASPAGANAVKLICSLDFPELVAREIELPVGCYFPECCRFCRPDDALEWVVELEGQAVAGVEVSMPSAKSSVRVPRGRTRLATPARANATEAGLARLRLLPDAAWLDRARAPAGTGAPSPGTVSLSVEQRVRNVLVNRFEIDWILMHCKQPSGCDTVELANNTGLDKAVIHVDGRRNAAPAACVEDELLRSAQTASVANMRPAAGCGEEVAVFSDDNAMALRHQNLPWTDQCGDRLDVALQPRRGVPVHFFLLIGDALSHIVWGKPITDVVDEDLANANQIYDQNKSGLVFEKTIHKLTLSERRELVDLLPSKLSEALGNDVGSLGSVLSPICALPAKFKELGYYVDGQLNVYYVPIPFGTGMICESDRNVIFVAFAKKPATLPHEFGHALSLLGNHGHTNGVNGFDTHNVMWTSEPDVRDHFSLGQVFRHNLEETSRVIVNGVGPGPARPCLPDATPSATCPALELDWVRP